MEKDEDPVEEFSTIAKQTMEQARGAMENYFSWLQRSISAFPRTDTELSKKLLSYAQQNIADFFEYVQKLSQAKDFQDLVRVQTEFVQAQLKSLGEQAKDLGITEDQVIKTVMLKETVDGEFTTVADVAAVAVFFAEFESNALTGQSLVVTHGWFMQ